jgi:uncharacterized SAM-binding protein YcdF (DUF218 family)
MKRFSLSFPTLAISPAASTREEALSVARLVADHRWSRVILVTTPLHMRRAAAVFHRAGVPALSA